VVGPLDGRASPPSISGSPIRTAPARSWSAAAATGRRRTSASSSPGSRSRRRPVSSSSAWPRPPWATAADRRAFSSEQGPARLAGIHRSVAEHSTEGAAGTMRGVQKRRPFVVRNLVEQMKTIVAPTLINDRRRGLAVPRARPVDEADDPTAALVVMPNCGHTINLEEPRPSTRISPRSSAPSMPAPGGTATRAPWRRRYWDGSALPLSRCRGRGSAPSPWPSSHPPYIRHSTSRSEPVTKLDASLARNNAAWAISSGRPSRNQEMLWPAHLARRRHVAIAVDQPLGSPRRRATSCSRARSGRSDRPPWPLASWISAPLVAQ